MLPTKGLIAARQAKIWWGFFLYAIRRYWWLIVAAFVLGCVWSYFTSVGTPNRYEVRASFVIPTEVAAVEYERIISRSLVNKAVNADSKFEVSLYSLRSAREPFNMYTGSPFLITTLAFPEHLRDRQHDIQLFEDHSFQITIHTEQGDVVGKGKAGVPLTIGSARLLVDRTTYWDAQSVKGQYAFVVQSQHALATRFLKNLEVIHSLDHPNRISLHYFDAHPELALDMLSAFTSAYLDDCKFRQDQFLLQRKAEINAQIRVLETEILQSNDQAFWKGLHSERFLSQDSTVVRMLQLRKKAQHFERRKTLWDGFIKGEISPDQLLQGLLAMEPEPQDSALRRKLEHPFLVSDPQDGKMRMEIRAEVDSLSARDSRERTSLNAELAETGASLMASFELQADGKVSFVDAGEPHAPSLDAMLFQTYLAALAESARLDLEMRKSFDAPQLIDPPYPIAGHGRDIKVRTFVAGVIGSVMLGLFVALVWALSGRRFGSKFHFQAISNTDFLLDWQLEADEKVQRIQSARLELDLEEDAKVIALVGDTPEVDRMADALAAGFCRFEKKVLIVNSVLANVDTAWERMTVPQSTKPAWWFSESASNFLLEKSGLYDRILLCLPNPSQAPEVEKAMLLADKVFFVIWKNRTEVKQWRAFEGRSTATDVAVDPIFVEI